MGLLAYTTSLYDVLGISETAPPEAIRKAYKKKALETHPDKLPPDATDEERERAEAQFRDVYQALEILGDAAKRRVYDNGLNFLRGRTRSNEVQAKLARDRAEWDRQSKLRQEERLRELRAQMQARREKAQQRKEELKAEMSQQSECEMRVKALEEQLRKAHERQHQAFARTEAKINEKIQLFERIQIQASSRTKKIRAASIRSSRSSIAETLASTSELINSDDFMKEFKRMNPEWEERRQAALKQRAERLSQCTSTKGIKD